MTYDRQTHILEVGFKNGDIVYHQPVSEQTWIDLQANPEKGSFYAKTIKKIIPGKKG